MELMDDVKPLAFFAFMGEGFNIRMYGMPEISLVDDLVGEREGSTVITANVFMNFLWCEAPKVWDTEVALI